MRFALGSLDENINRSILADDVARVAELLQRERRGGTLLHNSSESHKQGSWLHVAAFSNGVRTAEMLIYSGFDVNCRDPAGDTPLHIAAQYGSWEVADLLLEYRADINARNGKGQTPLDVAVQHGNHHMAELLRLIARTATG